MCEIVSILKYTEKNTLQIYLFGNKTRGHGSGAQIGWMCGHSVSGQVGWWFSLWGESILYLFRHSWSADCKQWTFSHIAAAVYESSKSFIPLILRSSNITRSPSIILLYHFASIITHWDLFALNFRLWSRHTWKKFRCTLSRHISVWSWIRKSSIYPCSACLMSFNKGSISD